MKHKLISIALIAVLICMVLGNNVACGPTTYNLTITSTAGGNVTAPVEGTYAHAANATVDLTATPDADYHFVKWTASAGTFDDEYAPHATFTMPAQDATVTANFGFDMTFIEGVPDASQPPTQTILPPPPDPSNYCAPMAMVNVLGYWDAVMGHSNAENLTAFQQPPNLNTVAEYLGYFMDTNDDGDPLRDNNNTYPPAAGTYASDIGPGTWNFVRWDAANPFPAPAPTLPTGKLGYNWTMTDDYMTDASPGDFAFYKAEIDAGRPLVVCFRFWNPVAPQITFPDPETGETIDVFDWGDQVSSSEDPQEEWNWYYEMYGKECIGHAVTGVGYKLNWDPDGSGPLPQGNYVIVHDNWAPTPENVAVLWANWNSSHAADPGADV